MAGVGRWDKKVSDRTMTKRIALEQSLVKNVKNEGVLKSEVSNEPQKIIGHPKLQRFTSQKRPSH